MLWILFLLCVIDISHSADPLGSYNVNPELVTVSGLSSGAAFATQIHVALSGTIKGAATFAGVPYYCSEGLLLLVPVCMTTPSLVDLGDLTDQADRYSDDGDIDPTTNMAGQRVAIWHGGFDVAVDPDVSDLIEEFYIHYGAEIRYETVGDATHCIPTENYGNPCSMPGSPYINDCDYAGAFRALDWLYRGLIEPDSGTAPTQLLEYDQAEFAGESKYFDPDGGYLYVPTECATGAECALHVAFHGCNQGREFVGDDYARHAGYLEVAEANNIIVLFPQLISDSLFGDNPYGCYDWWGFDGGLDEMFYYATRSGVQVSAVKRMIDRVLGNE